jgi:hypothetical protein
MPPFADLALQALLSVTGTDLVDLYLDLVCVWCEIPGAQPGRAQ